MGNPNGVEEIIDQWSRVRPELDVSAMSVFGPLHRAFLLYREQIAAVFEVHGTNESGFDVLAALRRSPEFTSSAGDLAAQTLVTTGGLSLRVKRLVEAGLVIRTRDEVDARVVYVSLTPAGHELIDRVAEVHFANESRMLQGLSVSQRSQLGALLGALERSLHEARRSALPAPSGVVTG